MNDTNNTPDDGQEPTKERTVHLQVKEGTRAALDELRIQIRQHGVKLLPAKMAKLLEQDWTADVLIRAAILAFSDVIERTETPETTPSTKKGKGQR